LLTAPEFDGYLHQYRPRDGRGLPANVIWLPENASVMPGTNPYHLPVAALLVLAAPVASRVQGMPEAPVTYEQHVRPILKTHCFQCHGEAGKVRGKLDVRLRRTIVAGGSSGAAVVPGKPDESHLLQRLVDEEMPPEEVKKRPQPHEIELIRRWIAAGAPTARPEPAAIGQGPYFTEEERSWWAFQPVQRRAIPAVTGADQVRTPLDAFLLARLEAKGLTFSPAAEKHTLIRRASFDLLGLPPSPDEVDRFLADSAADAYERLLARLLASPAYGERWGRHWLDVAGYADSEGDEGTDAARDDAYSYRDYVIRSFNQDKPFDRFLQEQLAGDEMVRPPYEKLTGEDAERLAATGFLRMAPDPTGLKDVDQKVARNQVVADTIQIVSSSLLGLTVACAQCHDHRYDPITQEDYYRQRAIFEPAYDVSQWRTPQQRQVVLSDGSTPLKAPGPAQKKSNNQAKGKAARAPGGRPVRPLTEVPGRVPVTRLFYRGDYDQPRQAVPPGELTLLAPPDVTIPEDDPSLPTTGRRLAYARWLTSGRHPLVARVLVNRVWMHHFGRGLVATPADFGTQGERPTHPALLDWLAAEFMDSGWSLKRLHKQIMTSTAYRQASQRQRAGEAVDVENTLLWRMPVRRLEGEAVRDALLSVSGVLNPKQFGPPVPVAPDPDGQIVAGAAAVRGEEDEPAPEAGPKDGTDSFRRTVYVQVRRTLPLDLLDVFDMPTLDPNCEVRSVSTAPPQALFFLNNKFTEQQADLFARRVRREAADHRHAQVRHAFRLALARAPSPRELDRCLAFLEIQAAAYQGKDAGADGPGGRALADLCRALLATNEFVCVD
jgi:hypothetical protein